MNPMRKGEVWWVDFDPSIGGEIQKMRPAVIVSNDVANARLNRVQVVPLTTNVERVFPGEAIVRFRDEARKAMANQIMTAAKERFGRRIGDLNRTEMVRIGTAILVQLGLDHRTEQRGR
jgi:mRNA interferase MazF